MNFASLITPHPTHTSNAESVQPSGPSAPQEARPSRRILRYLDFETKHQLTHLTHQLSMLHTQLYNEPHIGLARCSQNVKKNLASNASSPWTDLIPLYTRDNFKNSPPAQEDDSVIPVEPIISDAQRLSSQWINWDALNPDVHLFAHEIRGANAALDALCTKCSALLTTIQNDASTIPQSNQSPAAVATNDALHEQGTQSSTNGHSLNAQQSHTPAPTQNTTKSPPSPEHHISATPPDTNTNEQSIETDTLPPQLPETLLPTEPTEPEMNQSADLDQALELSPVQSADSQQTPTTTAPATKKKKKKKKTDKSLKPKKF